MTRRARVWNHIALTLGLVAAAMVVVRGHLDNHRAPVWTTVAVVKEAAAWWRGDTLIVCLADGGVLRHAPPDWTPLRIHDAGLGALLDHPAVSTKDVKLGRLAFAPDGSFWYVGQDGRTKGKTRRRVLLHWDGEWREDIPIEVPRATPVEGLALAAGHLAFAYNSNPLFDPEPQDEWEFERRAGDVEVWTFSAGSTERRVVHHDPNYPGKRPSLSADGTVLGWVRNTSFVTTDLTTGRTDVWSADVISDGLLSPNARRAIVDSSRTGHHACYLLPGPGSRLRRLTRDGPMPVELADRFSWSSSSRWLSRATYVGDGEFQLSILDLDNPR